MCNALVAVFMMLFLLSNVCVTSAQVSDARSPTPVEPLATILDAFQMHDVVALTDPHGNVQMQTLLLSLIRDPRFSTIVSDIVIETASSRYQDAIDRFVRGEDVPRDVLRRAWEDHTVANSIGVQADELLSAVRAVNASLTNAKKLRVIAGDPPIDWDNVMSREDHRRWIELRDTYPADLIRRQVLDRGRRALVIYGQGHLQRRQIASNYDMSTWESQTLVSLLEREPAVRIFNVWTLLDKAVELPDGISSWHVPTLAVLQGTKLGAMSFESYSRGLGSDTRFAVQAGRFVQLPREQWQTMRMEDQFNAILYLGPPSSMNNVAVPPALCQDSQFMTSRLQRIARFSPPVEVDNLKKACGL